MVRVRRRPDPAATLGRQVAFRDGAWRNTVLYGLLREEYRPWRHAR